MKVEKIGYARVSAPHQNLDRQIAALRAEGCSRVFREKASAKALKGRPQLEKAIDALPKSGVLVLAEWDRATRSMIDGIQIIERVYTRGAFVKVLDKPHLDLTTTIGRGFLAFLSALAQDDRERILKRANEGRVAARRRGAVFGRPPKLTEHQRREVLARLRSRKESARQIAKSYNVSHSTISRLSP